MKLRTTTPASISLVARLTLIAVSILVVVAIPIQMTQKVFADQYDDRIAALQQDINNYNAQSAALDGQANTLQTAVGELQVQISSVQAQIDLSQVKFDKLVAQIAETEQKIKSNQDALGKIIADLYVDDKITPIEMLASSNNISDYLDKQEYRSSVRSELSSTILKIKDLKKSLETQKSEIGKILDDQKNARQALADKQSEKQTLLDQTQGQEAAYQQLSSASEAKKRELQDQQQAAIWAAENKGGTVTSISDPTKGNYPWAGNGCYVDDDLNSHGGINGDGTDELGYACRQCTSYAAWKVLEHTGNAYRYWGNANMWPKHWSNQGTAARANSVGVITSGAYGHVVWVETDPDAEGYIIISQYNSQNLGGPGWGQYSKIRVHQSTYNKYLYF